MTDEALQAVRIHLNDVLASAPFRRSPRCREFLQYVMEHAIDGRTELLKERSLGCALFGRKADYETADDSIVRVRANEVRKRLAEYYKRGPEAPVQFDMPVGSYIPRITFREPAAGRPAREAASTPTRKVWTWVVAAALAAIAFGALALWQARPRATALDEFWSPVAHSVQPALLWSSAGQYQLLSPRALHELNQAAGKPVPVRFGPGDVESIDGLTTSGNLHCIVSIFAHLQQMGRTPEYRLGSYITLQELGSRPLILIGAFSNPWVMQLNSSLRFQFVRGRQSIRDAQVPGRSWTPPALEPPTDFDATVDYALVTRLFRQDTRQVLIAAGGIKHFGTGAAGEFLANPDYWREALPQLPKDWAHRNLQIVLETQVIRKMAGPPRVLAVHCW
jgi:hypothetical protein